MTSTIDRPARVGAITDQTGALSFMGIANVNMTRMVIDDINSKAGLLGRPVELFIEDSATDDGVAKAASARLVEADVDVVVGGIYSSTRQAEAIERLACRIGMGQSRQTIKRSLAENQRRLQPSMHFPVCSGSRLVSKSCRRGCPSSVIPSANSGCASRTS